MKSRIKKAIRHILYRYHHFSHERFYRKVMSLNGIENKPVAGEEAWIKKWSQFGIKASPTQYRVFSHYIGNDVNIVPEDICHDFIEPILNPSRYVGYYADKNVFDKLFPKGYFPQTVVRKMNGIWYDKQYERIPTMTDDILLRFLQRYEKIIVKPSVDGISGIGVRMFVNENGAWIDAKTSQKLSVDSLDNGGVIL